MGCRQAAPTIVADDAALDTRTFEPKVSLVEVTSDDVLVAVHADGSILVEQTAVSLPLLEKSAAAWTAKTPEIRVRIAADAATPHARVIEIIDAMKRSGVKKFALMVAPKSS